MEGVGGWTMDSEVANIDSDRTPVPPKRGRRLPTTTEAALFAAVLIGLMAYLSFLGLTNTADQLERQIDQVEAARGAVEAP